MRCKMERLVHEHLLRVVAVVVDLLLLQRLHQRLLLLDLQYQHQHPLCREDHNCVLHQWVLVDLPDLMGFAPCCK